MKKIVVIWSSPNGDGLTAQAKNRLLAGVRAAGAQAEEVPLNALRLEHCRACGNGWGTCRKDASCVIGDDFAPLYDKLAGADGIVFVTAVYFHDLTEQFKALLDRLRRCDAFTGKRLRDKRCFLTACAGGTGLGAIECLTLLEKTLGHVGMKACDRIPVTRFNRDYTLPALEKAGELYARRLETGFDYGY